MLIYALKDPRTDQVRYVGKTNNLKIRLYKHLYDARNDNGHNQHVYNWIRVLIANGLQPLAEIIEKDLSPNEAIVREIFWISEYRKQGARLTNQNGGGLGFGVGNSVWVGRRHSDETKRKMSSSGRGRVFSLETRMNQSSAKGGAKRQINYMSKLDRGAPPKGIKILDLETGGLIKDCSSLLEVSKFLGVNRGYIKRRAESGKPYLNYKFELKGDQNG